MPKYGVFSGPSFPLFRLNIEIYTAYLRFQSEQGKRGSEKLPIWAFFTLWEMPQKISNTPALSMNLKKK